jgi:hypothetical protein
MHHIPDFLPERARESLPVGNDTKTASRFVDLVRNPSLTTSIERHHNKNMEGKSKER